MEDVPIPEGAKKKDELAGFSLYSLSHFTSVAELLADIKDELEWGNDQQFSPDLLILADTRNSIRLVLFSLREIVSIAQIRESLQDAAVQQTGSISRNRVKSAVKIPVIYDTQNQWLFLPIDTMAKEYLSESSKSWGPSGTHYRVQRLNRFIDDLCNSQKIKNILYDDSLEDCKYYDIRTSPNNDLFVMVSSDVLQTEVANTVHLLNIKTLDQLPVFYGETSLISLVYLILGYNTHTSELPQNSQIDSLLQRSMGRDNLDRMIQVDNSIISLRSVMRVADDELIQALFSTYDHHEGFPVSAILCASKPQTPYKASCHILFGVNGHPELLSKSARYTLSNGPVSIYAFLDARLFLRPEINPYTGLQFSLAVTEKRDIEGNELPENLLSEVNRIISIASAASLDFGSQRFPTGITLVNLD